jgi:ribokinase
VSVVSGDNAIIVASGANMALTPAEASDIAAARGDICVGQLEVPLPATEAAFRAARAAGALTVLNAAPAQALPGSLLDVVDVLVVNETELAALSDRAITASSNDDEILAAALKLAGDSGMVITTLGARGAVAVGRETVHRTPGHAVDVVDTTGAGDCFVGALAAALADGVDRHLAMERANAAAALCVQRIGAAPSMPTASQLDAYLRGT